MVVRTVLAVFHCPIITLQIHYFKSMVIKSLGCLFIAIDDDIDEDNKQNKRSPFGSSFRTFDGTDYSNIATVDVKKSIFDLCTDSSDCYLAVIEVTILIKMFSSVINYLVL